LKLIKVNFAKTWQRTEVNGKIKLMSNPVLVVMSAGIGSRYGGIKQIDPVGPNGEIIIDYSLYDALQAGFRKVVFIIRSEIEKSFREKIGKEIEKRAETIYVFQELGTIPEGFVVPKNRTKPWGTGHAVLMCKNQVREPFAVINADDCYGARSFQILFDFLKKGGEKEKKETYLLVGYLLKNTLSDHGHVSRGVCTPSPDGYLLELNERLTIQKFGNLIKYALPEDTWVEISPESPVSMNMWGFMPSFFNELEIQFPQFLKKNIRNPKSEFIIPDVVSLLLKEKKVRVKILHTPEKWFGISYKEDKLLVQKTIQDLIARGIYPEKLWK